MAINIKAKETLQNIGPYKDTYRYVMGTKLYSKLNEQKMMCEAAMRSGIPQNTENPNLTGRVFCFLY